MTAKEFVNELEKCAPHLNQLVSSGLSVTEAEHFIATFHCAEMSNLQDSVNFNPILELISHYDISTLEIGMITFLQPAIENTQSWLVGKDETALLIIDRTTGEIRIEETIPVERVIMLSAKDGSSFLDALLLVACFLGVCSYDTQLYEDNDAKVEQAEKCANIAGGTQYLPFYQYLLGVE